MADYYGKNIPKLGFGLMRLPKKGIGIDVDQTGAMADKFLAAGFTYLDTAFVYPGSEAAAKKAIVDRHPRESFLLASKLNATIAVTERAAKKQFATSLGRSGAGYFDHYLLHALQENNVRRYDKFHLWDFVLDKKEQGLIKHVGFSFHGKPALLDQLLKDHPEVEFVQLQINYADWENPDVVSRANYETARKYDKGVVIMEPVKGGRLADPPEEVKKLFKDYAPDASYASWAIRFAASLDGVITVLSGMSNMEQMENNLSFMGDFKPLNDEEQQIIAQAQKILGNSAAIPCTACHYCTEGCPQNIPIPDVFAAANKQLSGGQMAQAKEAYAAAVKDAGKASDCIACGQCERACPQHIPVIENLKKCADMLE